MGSLLSTHQHSHPTLGDGIPCCGALMYKPPQNTIIQRRFRWNWHTAGPSQSLLSVSSVKFKVSVLVCVLSELKWQPPVRGDVVISPLLSCLLSTPFCLLLPLQLVPDALGCGKHARRPETQAFSIRNCSRNKHVVIVNQKVYFNTHYPASRA